MSKQFKHLSPAFLQAMEEIGELGLQKHGENSFYAMKEKTRKIPRHTTTEIMNHARQHTKEYELHLPHDHFHDLLHQLAAVAFNAMVEAQFAHLVQDAVIDPLPSAPSPAGTAKMLPLTCTQCNRDIGPLYPIDADCAGWMCDECYAKLATPSPAGETASEPEKDACEVCHGTKGGIKGNENVVDGVVMCDYCHAAALPEPVSTEGAAGLRAALVIAQEMLLKANNTPPCSDSRWALIADALAAPIAPAAVSDAEKRLRNERNDWRRKYFEMERAQSQSIDLNGEHIKRIQRLEREKDEIRNQARVDIARALAKPSAEGKEK